MTETIEWEELGNTRRLILGEVGVDSASIMIGDKASPAQREIYTPEGDGRYAIYAQILNGRRCLVIDFDAIVDHGNKTLRRTPSNWQCPDCGASERSGGTSNELSFFECENGHRHEVENYPIRGIE